MTGRTLAIGDVHGCDVALEALLGAVSPAASDTVVFLGDLIDRGPSPRRAVELALGLRTLCRVVLITGNHEELMRDAITGRGPLSAWLDAGGRSTLASYGGTPEKIPPDHLRFLCATTPFHETETEIFVHACLEPDVSLVNQTSDYLRWKHLGGRERPHVSGKRVVCGHTAQTDGRPLLFDGWVCIDTAACSGGWLTCLDAGTNLVTQASQGGRIRAFPLTS